MSAPPTSVSRRGTGTVTRLRNGLFFTMVLLIKHFKAISMYNALLPD